MANSIKADVVVTYPTDSSNGTHDWKVLQLTRNEALWIRRALGFALDGQEQSTDSVRVDDPKAYAQ